MNHFKKKPPLFQEYQYPVNKFDIKLSAKIKVLKRNLMSRDTNHQKRAILTIYKQLKKKHSHQVAYVVLMTDVPGLLCDILNNHNSSLIKAVFLCLLELSKYEEFYVQNHPDIVIDYTTRTLKILIKKSSTMITIYLGIKLLSLILSRCQIRLTANSVLVFEFTKDVFYNPLLQPVHLNTMVLLRLILKDEEFNHRELIPVVYKALKLLSELNENNNKKFNRHISLATDIMMLSLRPCCADKFSSVSLKAIDTILHLIESSTVPFIQKLDVRRCHAGFMRRQLNCLVSVYLCLDGDTLSSLSNKLASAGFLTLLPTINLYYQNETLHSHIMLLLSHILVKLAISVLDLSDKDSQFLTAGLQHLPPDVSKWPQLLAQPQKYDVYPSIIVYFYFFFLCADRLQRSKSSAILSESSSHLSAFCQFILSHHSPMHFALIKGIWLCYAILSLSQPASQLNNKSPIQAASRLLVNWVRATSLECVYTHHPALLVWCFSSFCPRNTLQLDMTMLWMRDPRQPSINQVESLAFIKKDTTLCLLDVLSCGSEDVTCRVMNILKKVGKKENCQRSTDLSNRIWANLATTLSALFSPHPETKVHNVACVVNLACKLVPAAPDTTTFLRVSNQLQRTFHIAIIDSTLAQILHSQLFKLAHVLLLKMITAKDYRVLESFVHNVNFIKALLASLDCKNQLVLLPALKLLTFLQYKQRLHSIQVKMSQRVSGETMLQLINDPVTQIASLGLISQLFTANRIQGILEIPTVLPEYFILALNLEFHSLSLKTKEGWRCQTLLLQYCQTHNSQMELHMLTHSWIYLSFKRAVTRNDWKNALMLKFVQEWLDGLMRFRSKLIRADYSRALCQDRLSQTLTLLATTLVQQEDLIDAPLITIATKICNLGGNIPDNVMRSLKNKVQSKRTFGCP